MSGYCCDFWCHQLWAGDITGHCLSYRHHPRAAKRTDGWEYDRENVGISSDSWVREEIDTIFTFHWGNTYTVLEAPGRAPAVLIKGSLNEDQSGCSKRLGPAQSRNHRWQRQRTWGTGAHFGMRFPKEYGNLPGCRWKVGWRYKKLI